MSDKPIPIASGPPAGFVAPTPQNTPLNPAPVAGLSKPTVPDIAEGEEKDASDNDDDDEGDDPTAGLDATQAAAIYSMVQNKLEGLVGKSSGYIESLPLPVRKRVEGLKGVHGEYSKLEKEYKRELMELDRKYLGLYKPVFDRRRAILNGDAEPTEAEIKAAHELALKDDPQAEPLPEKDDKADVKDVKGIPEFWLTALRNHMDISETITDRDEEALKSLTDITLDLLPGTEGYTLTFHFASNEFFTNETLTKKYYYQPDLDYLGDWNYQRAEGCTINWKEDKDLTKTVEVRKQRNKNTNRTRVVRKTKKTPSFFDFFSPPTAPSEEAIENGEIDDEELDELRYKLEMDYDIGEDLKERVIPRAIDYFTGKALEYDMLGNDDEEEIGSEEEDEEDEDEESEEEVAMPKKKKGGKPGAAAAGGNQDCKNQ